MEDAVLVEQQPQIRQRQEEAEASGSSALAWGTLEELFLVSAVSRHGTGDWSNVSRELQSRVKLLALPSSSFSSEACKSKFDALSGRYGGSGFCNGGNAREQHPPWFEDVRKRRVAHLKRELERHDGCIASLTNKLKRLKAERAQNLQVATKQQHFPEKSAGAVAVVEASKPADQSTQESCIVQDGELEVDKRNSPGKETGVSKVKEDAEVEKDGNRSTVEETKKEETPDGKSVASTGAVKLASDEATVDGTVDVADTPETGNEASGAAEMDVDTKIKCQDTQNVEVGPDVDTATRVDYIDEKIVDGSQQEDGDKLKSKGDDLAKVITKDGDEVSGKKSEEEPACAKPTVCKPEDEAAKDAARRENGDGMDVGGKSAERSRNVKKQALAAPLEDKVTIGAASRDPGADDHRGMKQANVANILVPDELEGTNASSELETSESAADVTGSKEAVNTFDGNFVGSASKNLTVADGGDVTAAAAAAAATVDSGDGVLLESEKTKAGDAATPVSSEPVPEADKVNKSEADQQPQDAGVKVGNETVAERPKARRISQGEKESSASAAQHSSSTDRKPVSDLNEKSDESHEGTRPAEAEHAVVSKASAQDVGSSASVDEGSASAQEQSKDSRVERSDGGSQADGHEDTSPTSRRAKKETARILKLQPLMDCLRTISSHKLASFFRKKQQSQDDPRYGQIVRRHIDLNMIRARLKEGAYSGSLEFFRDILLVFNNSIVFYPRDSSEHNAAIVMRKLVMEEMDKVIQAEATVKPEKPAARRRDTAADISSTKVGGKRDRDTAATTTTTTPTTTTAPARQGSLPPATPAATAAAEITASDTSRSKSASLSPGGGVPSSKGGEEDDIREGEPEVEGGKAKPLKAYGRKNKAAGNGEHKSGKGVTREKPLDAIVKKIGKVEEAAPAPAAAPSKDKEKDKGKEKEKEKDRAASSSKDKNKDGGGKDTSAPKTAAANQEKQPGSSKASGKKGKAAAAAAAASAAAAPAATSNPVSSSQQQGDDVTGVAATAPVRGVRNKRSAKEGQRAAAKRTKR